MTIIKIEIGTTITKTDTGSITGDQTNTNTTETNTKRKSSSNLEQVQQFFKEDLDIVFDALVAADYIDKIECTDGICQQQA